MEKLIDKMIFWLYDTLGLFLPGILFGISSYSVLNSIENFQQFEQVLKNYISRFNTNEMKVIYLIFAILLIYILGNVVKILAQLFYDIFGCLFDELIINTNKFEIQEKNKHPIKKFFKKYLNYIFLFKPQNYSCGNEFMIDQIMNKINKNSRISIKKDEWYMVG